MSYVLMCVSFSGNSGSGDGNLLGTGGVPLDPVGPPTLTYTQPREANQTAGKYKLRVQNAHPSVLVPEGTDLPLAAFLFRIEDQGTRRVTYIWKVSYTVEPPQKG